MRTPEEQFAIDKVIVEGGINEPFWGWFRGHLQRERSNAIIYLTNTPISPDNVYQIAAQQERLRILTELLKKPYDLLGIPEPR